MIVAMGFWEMLIMTHSKLEIIRHCFACRGLESDVERTNGARISCVSEGMPPGQMNKQLEGLGIPSFVACFLSFERRT